MKLKKLAQMEMIGLIFIVFLMSIGMLYLVSTSNKENRLSKDIDPQNVDLAQNTIDAIKYLKLDCPPPVGKKVRIDDLIRDMVTNDNFQISCNGIPSAAYVNMTIVNIFDATLDSLGKSYYFTIIKNKGGTGEKSYIVISKNNCNLNSNNPGEGSQPSPLKGGAGTVTMSLIICDIN